MRKVKLIPPYHYTQRQVIKHKPRLHTFYQVWKIIRARWVDEYRDEYKFRFMYGRAILYVYSDIGRFWQRGYTYGLECTCDDFFGYSCPLHDDLRQIPF